MDNTLKTLEKWKKEAISKKDEQRSGYSSQSPLDNKTEPDKKVKREVPQKKFSRKEYKKMREELFTIYRPSSLISEQFRMLRATILRLSEYRHIRTILVTSALPEEGKTFVASNLAVSIAQGFNGRVILVDSDLRRPSIHKLFQLKQEGLSTFLLNKQKFSDLLQETYIRNLSVISSGLHTENPSELLSLKKMKYFIEEARSCYKDCFIIFDSVPVMLSETMAMADLVDGILLVVKAGKTGRHFVKKAIEDLGKEKVIGVVLNYCKKHAKAYQRYYHYYESKKKG